MIGWSLAFVLVFVILTATALIAQWMANRHEYRMKRLEQDGEIVRQADKNKEESMEM